MVKAAPEELYVRAPAVVFQSEDWNEEVELRVKDAFDVPRAESGGQVPLSGLQEVQVCAAAGNTK